MNIKDLKIQLAEKRVELRERKDLIDKEIKALYNKGFKNRCGDLDKLAQELELTKKQLVRRAVGLKLRNKHYV